MNQLELRKCLSSNIKKRRKIYAFTQEKLAEETGLSAQTINDIEGCRTWVSDKSIIRIAEALHTSPAELLMPSDSNIDSDRINLFRLKRDLQESVNRQIEEIILKYLNSSK
ncbi:MAG: helix-turn-helix transcriptional regulator [Spirochaetaceae bacterium]|nr:helix-turn-helix transcriptional regulator [Spirochaetaceae bacterium]